jgi:CBS domain-containing protein
MNASSVMVSDVITAKLDDTVQHVAELLLLNRISAVPVVNESDEVVGIVSEGDLLRRAENDTGHERPWWLKMLVGRDFLAAEFIKENGRTVADVMTREVVCAEPDTAVADIAELIERHRIKRVPIIQNGKLVGIVSRANLIQALAVGRNKLVEPQNIADAELRDKLLVRLKAEPWVRPCLINVTVNDGTVDLWGMVDSSVEKHALRVAAETTPGVKTVNDNLLVPPAGTGE